MSRRSYAARRGREQSVVDGRDEPTAECLNAGGLTSHPGQPCRRWLVASLGWSATAHTTWSATLADGADGENLVEQSGASRSFWCG
jgi:hypothetical protein